MPFAVQIDPATRARVERIHKLWNVKSERGEHAWPLLSKNQLYRALIAWGAAEYERVLGAKAPRGADEFASSKEDQPFEVERRVVGEIAPAKKRKAAKRPRPA